MTIMLTKVEFRGPDVLLLKTLRMAVALSLTDLGMLPNAPPPPRSHGPNIFICMHFY